MKSLQYYPHFKLYNILGEYYDVIENAHDIDKMAKLIMVLCNKIRNDLIGKKVQYCNDEYEILRIGFDIQQNTCYLILEYKNYVHEVVRDYEKVYLIE